MSVAKQIDQKRFIGYSNDTKKHQHHHVSGSNLSADEQRQHGAQETHKKKQYLSQQQQQQLTSKGGNTLGYQNVNSHQQTKNQFVGEFIPQQATDTLKKERRNKDRLSHLSKLLPHKARWIGYLDVGCGNAEISVTIAQHLGISSVYGVDMFSEDDFEQPSMDLEVKYIQNENDKMKIPDNSVDLITCFMAIHHFEHLDVMLREIQRVLLIDGYLFIREHDVPYKNKQLRTYIEEQHRKYPDHPTDGYMMLYDREELKDILFAYGFEHLGDSNYTGQNLQAVYHSLYTLKRKEVSPHAKQLIHKNRKNKSSNSLEEEDAEEEGGTDDNDQENCEEVATNSRESVNSKQDEVSLDFNELSLKAKKASSSLQGYNKKEAFEQFQQIALQQQSDSANSRSSSDEDEKEQAVVSQKKQTPLKQKITISEEKPKKKQSSNTNEKILNQVKVQNGRSDSNQANKMEEEEEEEDVYANIISVPAQKKGSPSLQQKVIAKKTVKTQEKPLLSYTVAQENSPLFIEPKQKTQILDEDGFVVVGQKDNKKKPSQQQQLKNTIPEAVVSQKIQDNHRSTTENTFSSVELKSKEVAQMDQEEEEGLQLLQQQQEDSNDDPSNQFIYIKSKKQTKKKNKK